jgi:hypothetical protein
MISILNAVEAARWPGNVPSCDKMRLGDFRTVTATARLRAAWDGAIDEQIFHQPNGTSLAQRVREGHVD